MRSGLEGGHGCGLLGGCKAEAGDIHSVHSEYGRARLAHRPPPAECASSVRVLLDVGRWQQIVECYSTVLCGCGRLDKCGLDSRVGGQTIKLRAIFLGFKADRLGIHRRRRPFVVWREF